MNEDNLNERDDCCVPFSDQQYRHGSYYISLFKYKSFDQSGPPESPQILNIRELKQTDAVAVNRQIPFKFRVLDVKGRLNSLGLESF